MSKVISRSIHEPIRENPNWQERWKGPDKGLITCWEVGRAKAEKEPRLVMSARKGELPVLGWKGGVAKKTKKEAKFGTLYYLAQWQGLREESLEIDPEKDIEIICSKTGIKVTFTGDPKKYSDP